MKKPQIFLITFILIITSFSFPQSGAAKSLEIGNKWVYQMYEEGLLVRELIGTINFNNYTYAIIENTPDTWLPIGFESDDTNPIYQRADSNKIYTFDKDLQYDTITVDYTNITTVFPYFGQNYIEYYFGDDIDNTDPRWYIRPYTAKHHRYLKGIGIVLDYFESSYSTVMISKDLIACRINGVEYGDLTYLYVENDENNTIPIIFKLTQNFPNPFNPTTQISYELPQESDVEIVIYNSIGEEVNTLINKSQSIGRYTIDWNGLNSYGEQVPGGIYFYTIKTKEFTQTKKMLLLR